MRVPVGEIELEVNVDGDEGAPAVVLLHGFPDSKEMWRHQVAALTAAGYRTIVPDLRGFGSSDRPEAVDAYSILFLVGDVVGLLDHFGIERAHVVGHDWGAAVAWGLAAFVPDRVDHLVAMSVGHPSSFVAAGLEQREKSWYMLLFQFEEVAEQWLSADDFKNLREWGRHPNIEAVVERMSEPGALTAGLNWYRANVHPRNLVGPPIVFPPIAAPTMGVWSAGDFALTEKSMTGSSAFIEGPWRYERIEDVGHWMQLDAPETVNSLLIDFLGAPT